MLKRITIEKAYWALLLIIMGFWGAMNMLHMEHDSYATDGTPIIKITLGLTFLLSAFYLVVNYKYLHIDKIGTILLFFSIYLLVARVVMLPYTVGLLSYFYAAAICLTNITLYLSINIAANKSDELRNFISTCTIIGMLIIAYFYLQNWQFTNQIVEAHLGTSYWIFFLLPVLLYSPKKWLKYIGLILTAIVLLSSFKRGGILALILGIFAYLVVKEIFIGKRVKTLTYFVLAVTALIVILIFVDNAMGNIISERFLNIKEDGGSNRIEVWTTTWDMIKYSEAEFLLVGHGFNSVELASPLGLSAHNDFLESIYDFGIFGSIFYVLLHISLIKQIIRNIRLKNEDASIMAFTYTFFFVLSMISHVLIYPWFTFMVISWGFGSASEQKALQKSNIQSVTPSLINT